MRHLARRPGHFYYRTCLQTVKALALTTFYLGSNYLVVRQGNAAVGHLPFAPQIPFAPLFYAFTALIPLAYLYYGLRRHDRLVLVMGLLTVASSVFTLRYYRTLLPPIVAATLAVILLLAIVAAPLPTHPAPRPHRPPPMIKPPRCSIWSRSSWHSTTYQATPQPPASSLGAAIRAAAGPPGNFERYTPTGWYSLARCATA